jgi:hypothetical protein
MSLSDGGSPWVAQADASTTTTPSGTWTLTVRNTGTSASSGTTQIQFDASATGYFLPSAGTGWTCADTGDRVRTCTNTAAVPPGGSLPPLTFPWASLPRYGYAYAQAILTNPSDGTIGNNTLSIYTPVAEPTSTIDVVASVSDGGVPFTGGGQAAYSVTVRNVGTSAASGVTTVHYPTPLDGMTATGSGWTCTDSSVADPTCTYPGGLAAGAALPPITITGAVPGQDAPATVRAQVSVDNASDAFTNDNYTYLDTSVTPLPIDVVASVSDGGVPFTAGGLGTFTVTVRNVGTSAATGAITVHYPTPLDGMAATGSGWACTASTVSDPTCVHYGGLPAGSVLPPVKITGTVPDQNAPYRVRGLVSVDNASDAFTNDNSTYVDTAVNTNPYYLPKCPSLQFFGVRGSGETASDGDGYGTTVQGFEQELATQVPRLATTPIEYPAVAVGYSGPLYYKSTYKNSVAAGKNTLQTALLIFWSKCPRTYVMLAGYSQGAQVAGDVADTLTMAQRAHVAAVALFGDPRFNPLQPQVDVPGLGYNPNLEGIYQFADKHMRQVPLDLMPRVHSYCLQGDPICNYKLKYATTCALYSSLCPHLFYQELGYPSDAADWAVGLFRTLPKL